MESRRNDPLLFCPAFREAKELAFRKKTFGPMLLRLSDPTLDVKTVDMWLTVLVRRMGMSVELADNLWEIRGDEPDDRTSQRFSEDDGI